MDKDYPALNTTDFHLYIYTEPAVPMLDCGILRDYVLSIMPRINTMVRDGFIDHHAAGRDPEQWRQTLGDIASGFARAKVHNIMRHVLNETPLWGEIAYERRRLSAGSKVFGLFYDGLDVMTLLAGLIVPEERGRRHIHVVFTNQLFGTWEDADCRYHARTSLYGFPSLISTTGLVEAPAKPREFYLLKQQYTALGLGDAVDVGMKKDFQGRVLEHGDSRLTEVAKGYLLQAVFHQLWGEPFCTDKSCRLFNAHWQEEMLAAQLQGQYELCPHHQQMLLDSAARRSL